MNYQIELYDNDHSLIVFPDAKKYAKIFSRIQGRWSNEDEGWVCLKKYDHIAQKILNRISGGKKTSNNHRSQSDDDDDEDDEPSHKRRIHEGKSDSFGRSEEVESRSPRRETKYNPFNNKRPSENRKNVRETPRQLFGRYKRERSKREQSRHEQSASNQFRHDRSEDEQSEDERSEDERSEDEQSEDDQTNKNNNKMFEIILEKFAKVENRLKRLENTIDD
jgi:hypothetical protein